MNMDTGEIMPITKPRLSALEAAGFTVVAAAPGQPVVLLPDADYRREEQRTAKAKRRAARKAGDRTRRHQRRRA